MATRRMTVGAVLAMVLALGVSATVHGWTGQRNTLTFTAPVALPGVVLPAGVYRFEVVTAEASSNIVMVKSEGHAPYFMGFTRTVERPASLGNRVIVLGEAPAGTPPPIKAWYPIEGGMGHEFIYR